MKVRAFRVVLPSGTRYWTVVDDDFEVVKEADRFLREIRLARGRAETTTKSLSHVASERCGMMGEVQPKAPRRGHSEGLSLVLSWRLGQ